jgi:hypothetical protein
MAITRRNSFSRRAPDVVTEELTEILSDNKTVEFKELFEILYQRLRERNAASGGEEMLRLRAYEKLQNLVARGKVKKIQKSYQGVNLQPKSEQKEEATAGAT